jgi:hypothetical protein
VRGAAPGGTRQIGRQASRTVSIVRTGKGVGSHVTFVFTICSTPMRRLQMCGETNVDFD